MLQRLKDLVARLTGRRNHRAIFRYWDGSRQRACDPVLALIAIETDEEFRLDQHPQQVDEGDIEATRIMVRMVERVFRVKPFDEPTESGLTVSECLALYTRFCDYVESLKKTTGTSPTQPSPTAATSLVSSS